jgi:hypothetical protein
MTLPPEDNSTPAFVGPHEGREFDLMTTGEKHLSMFEVEGAEEYDDYPDARFEAAVAEGKFIKDVRLELYALPNHVQMSVRVILYARQDEAWRIPAMHMVRDVYRSAEWGWHPDLERMIGALLGYRKEDVEAFIERHSSLTTGH